MPFLLSSSLLLHLYQEGEVRIVNVYNYMTFAELLCRAKVRIFTPTWENRVDEECFDNVV